LRHNMKMRYQQQREHQKFKEDVISRHLTKTKHKELMQKKKEDLMEFSLLKQKEFLNER
jgi:hypothetical protein